MNYRYAAVVVLYQPDEKVKENIESYLADVAHIYAVDNTENKNNPALISWLKEKDNVTYMDLHCNEGLAKALNIGCHRAVSDGYDYAFTMDQDSFFETNAVKELIGYIENTPQDKVAIVAPIVRGLRQSAGEYQIDKPEQEVTVKNWVMTSGGGYV